MPQLISLASTVGVPSPARKTAAVVSNVASRSADHVVMRAACAGVVRQSATASPRKNRGMASPRRAYRRVLRLRFGQPPQWWRITYCPWE